jgi:AraC family transcriptional regulator
MEVSAGRCYADHAHIDSYCELVLSGRYTQKIGRERFVRSAGQVYLMSGRLAHSDEFLAPVRSISVEFLREQENHWVYRGHIDTFVPDVRTPALGRICRGLAREALALDAFSALAVDAHACELLVLALRGHKDQPGLRNSEVHWMSKVWERLNDEPGGSASINELAALAQVHPGHLARAFRMQFGLPIAQYQRQLRLQSAARALVIGIPIVEVSLAAGYAAQSQFTTAFKRAFGVTPAVYRRTHRA